MFHVAEEHSIFVVAQEVITNRIVVVITAVVNVTATVQTAIEVMRSNVAMGYPTAVFRTLENIVVCSLR